MVTIIIKRKNLLKKLELSSFNEPEKKKINTENSPENKIILVELYL